MKRFGKKNDEKTGPDGDRKQNGSEKRRGRRDGGAEKLAQDVLPLRAVEGSFIRRTDGASVLLVHFKGTNDSLFTYEQKLDEARALTSVLSAVEHPAAILKIPQPIDSRANLVFMDGKIEELEAEIRGLGYDLPERDPRMIRLSLLKERIRPKVERDSLYGDKYAQSTYFAFEYGGEFDDTHALRDANLFVEQVGTVGGDAHVCAHDEVIRVLQLFFRPDSVDSGAVAGAVPVLTKGEVRNAIH